jgi:hypothetical protein
MGNYGRDSGGECAVPMVHRFHSPSNGNVYYSTERDFLRHSVQYAWIEEDLRSVNRSRTPWLIVSSHRHMYTSESADEVDLIK